MLYLHLFRKKVNIPLQKELDIITLFDFQGVHNVNGFSPPEAPACRTGRGPPLSERALRN